MKFRLGSIPVRVHAAFLFLALFMAMNERDPRLIAIWVVVVFVSVLAHELGHALVGRAFGLTPQIDIHGMGGTTSWTSGPELGPGRRVAISLAGPFAGFALAALVMAFVVASPPPDRFGQFAARQLMVVNVVWGVFNLLPLLPLDGGNVMKTTLDAMTKGRGEKPARMISIVACAALLALAYFRGEWILGVLAVMFGVSNLRGLRDADVRRADAVLAPAIDKAHLALEKKDAAEAIALLRPALLPEASPELRAVGVQLLGYAFVLEGRWDEVLPLLEGERELLAPDDLARFARAARDQGRTDDADRIDALAKAPDPIASFKA